MEKPGRGSYATYVSHPLVLVSVMLAFRPLPLGAELKFVAVTAVAVPLCFAVGYLLTRVPVFAKVLKRTSEAVRDLLGHHGSGRRPPILSAIATPLRTGRWSRISEPNGPSRGDGPEASSTLGEVRVPQ